ncbi:MAG: putative toxin-antitoxin system toxin component, PIN family [Pirellulales bacterium]
MSTSEPPFRAVFDCNVLLQAMASPDGPAGKCLDQARAGSITLFLSEPIVAELLDVSARPVLMEKLKLSPARTQTFVEDLLTIATFVQSIPAVFSLPSDPKDAMYVDLAVACEAHVITTRDRHLLALRDSSNPVGADFRFRFASIEVLTPVELLRRVRGG